MNRSSVLSTCGVLRGDDGALFADELDDADPDRLCAELDAAAAAAIVACCAATVVVVSCCCWDAADIMVKLFLSPPANKDPGTAAAVIVSSMKSNLRNQSKNDAE